MLVGLSLFSGDQGGLNKKIVQGPTSFFRGLSPQKKEVLHDTLQDITEFLLTQAGLMEAGKERIESPISIE